MEITPDVADKLELWQISAIMERSAYDIANDQEEMSRRVVAERYRAAREGRELDPRDLFTGTSESTIADQRAAPTQR